MENECDCGKLADHAMLGSHTAQFSLETACALPWEYIVQFIHQDANEIGSVRDEEPMHRPSLSRHAQLPSATRSFLNCPQIGDRTQFQPYHSCSSSPNSRSCTNILDRVIKESRQKKRPDQNP